MLLVTKFGLTPWLGICQPVHRQRKFLRNRLYRSIRMAIVYLQCVGTLRFNAQNGSLPCTASCATRSSISECKQQSPGKLFPRQNSSGIMTAIFALPSARDNRGGLPPFGKNSISNSTQVPLSHQPTGMPHPFVGWALWIFTSRSLRMNTKNSALRPMSQMQLQSISDDDICSDCSHCRYQPGQLSECSQNWPGSADLDGYAKECSSWTERQQ